MNQDNYVSNCCNAGLIDFNEDTLEAICADCKEHCGAELTEDYIEELREECSHPALEDTFIISSMHNGGDFYLLDNKNNIFKSTSLVGSGEDLTIKFKKIDKLIK